MCGAPRWSGHELQSQDAADYSGDGRAGVKVVEDLKAGQGGIRAANASVGCDRLSAYISRAGRRDRE